MATIPLGVLQFENVEFDYEQLATALQRFVNIGSERGGIKKEDLTIQSRIDMGNRQFTDLATALNNGTRLFDALAYFSLPPANRPLIAHEPLEPGMSDPSLSDISRAVFYVFMWILIRGKAPSSAADANNGPVPNFLNEVMGLNEQPSHYSGLLASFDLAMMNPSWVQHIQLANIGQEAQNRLALGVAGYRVPAALVYIPWRRDLPEHKIRAAQAVRRFVRRGMTWDCFSGTRSGAFLDAVKNFNKNVENLLLDVADEQYIEYFVERKMLAVRPTRRAQYNQYLTWTNATFDNFVNYIFGENAVPDVEDVQHDTMDLTIAEEE